MQLAACPLGPGLGGDPVERLERAAELHACLHPASHAPETLAVAEPRTGDRTRGLSIGVELERRREVPLETIAGGEQSAAALGLSAEERDGRELRVLEGVENRVRLLGAARADMRFGKLELGDTPGT